MPRDHFAARRAPARRRGRRLLPPTQAEREKRRGYVGLQTRIATASQIMLDSYTNRPLTIQQ